MQSMKVLKIVKTLKFMKLRRRVLLFLETPYARLLYYIFCFVYLEMLFRIWVFKTVFDFGTLYSILFSVPLGAFAFLLSSFFYNKANRIISGALLFLITVVYAVQAVYFSVFKTFMSIYSVSGTSQVLEFWSQVLLAVLKCLPVILALFLPFIMLVVFGFKYFKFYPLVWRFLPLSACLLVLSQLLTVFIMCVSSRDIYSPYDLYFRTAAPELSVQKLGLFTTMRLDLKRMVFGFKPATFGESKGGVSDVSKENSDSADKEQALPVVAPQKPDYKFNTMEIDFDKLISNEKDSTLIKMHKYFSSIEPTRQNKYTALFKGCNFIFITAESFSHYVIDRELTPTLYKLAIEGFKFTNFYNPVWGVSTSDGEYVACTGLIPKSGVWSFYRSGENYMPFVMGNQFLKLGYTARAYHNHTYTYYKRDVSHPNMGYIYKGVGNGLNVKRTWPESDLEMIDVTTPEFINDDKFHVYYMTVSGHLNYSFTGNYIAYKNRQLVEHLPYSTPVKAYLACNIELDRALELLLKRLEEAGKLDNTVIAISPDHYPYGLSRENINELAGHEVEGNFELYKSAFILWKKGMEPVTVDKPCSSLDIIPTLSNLFGLEYDSRLLMGRDILSDSEPLVIFSNRSWITDKARYNAPAGKVEPLAGELPEGYVSEINNVVNQKFQYSALILEKNYYNVVFPDRNP